MEAVERARGPRARAQRTARPGAARRDDAGASTAGRSPASWRRTSRTRDIPIIFLTARADPSDRRLGEQLGGVGYLVKPFDPVSIGDVVEDVLVRIERGERDQLRRGISSEPGAVTTAERSEAADRARRLQRVAELLAEAVTPDEVLDSILTDGVRAAEARAGAIGVLRVDGRASSCSPSGATTPHHARLSSFPLDSDLPMSVVIRTRRAALPRVAPRNATALPRPLPPGAGGTRAPWSSRSRSRVASSARCRSPSTAT